MRKDDRKAQGTELLTPSQRLKTQLIGAIAYPTIAALCRTITWQVEGGHYFDEGMQSGHPPIIAFWHERILPAAWHFRNRGIVAMTSANFDGQWVARILERMGNRTAAGSTSRGGARALLGLKREIERGRPVAFALDGPRGPARVAQPGAVWLAAATGSPILPVHAEASRSWTVNSWDHTQVPRPFSKVAVVISEPMAFSEGCGEADSNQRLEETLRRSEARAREMLI